MSVARRAAGIAGEAAARAHLESLGWEILDANVRFGPRSGLKGELDLVARDGAAVVFVEVKARRGDPGRVVPQENVTPTKQRQIARLALAWAARAGVLEDGVTPLRFDVVAVVLSEDDAVRRLTLIREAFDAPDGL